MLSIVQCDNSETFFLLGGGGKIVVKAFTSLHPIVHNIKVSLYYKTIELFLYLAHSFEKVAVLELQPEVPWLCAM